MALFHYKLIEKEGKAKTGLINLPFDSPVSASNYLESKGGIVVYAIPVHPYLTAIVSGVSRFFEQPVKRTELAEALNNVSVMLKAGLPLLSAIKDAVVEHENPTLSRVGKELVMRIEGGATLAEAARAYPRVFPDTMTFLFRLGEESGSLDRTIRDASEHEIKVEKIYKDVKKALTYPTIILMAVLGALLFWVISVMPTMQKLFIAMKVTLPPFTTITIATVTWILDNGLYIVVGLFTTIASITWASKKYQPFRKVVHEVQLRLPVLKLVLVQFNLAFITAYLSLMLRSGVDVLHCLNVLSTSLPNEVFKYKLKYVGEQILQGISLKDAFSSVEMFPRFIVRMIGVGEQSGQLSEQLDYIARDYQARMDSIVKNISNIVEPIVLGIGGTLFAILAVAMFYPLMQLVGNVGK
ncbi:MAG: type II secretion system F family protein [Magnetococcales bacterium]|nr:type II secretion system F family protein [Magnetococcales bacterium]